MKRTLTALLLFLLCGSAWGQYNVIPPGTQNPARLNVLLSAELDSLSVRTGPDILSGWDFTSGWTASNVTVDDANSFTVDSSGGYLTKTSLFTTGTGYHLSVAGTSAGTFLGMNGPQSVTYLTDFGTSTFRASGSTTLLFRLQGTATGTTDITSLSLREYYLADNSPFARHLWPANEPTWTTVGTRRVMNFNGSTDLIDTGSDCIGTGDVTVEAWIRPETKGESNLGAIFSNGPTFLSISDSDFGAVIPLVAKCNYGDVARADASPIRLNQWAHVVTTYTASGAIRIYINGTLVGSGDVGAMLSGTTNVFIGNRAAADRTFDGDIPLVRIYDGILTATEIAALYAATSGDYE